MSSNNSAIVPVTDQSHWPLVVVFGHSFVRRLRDFVVPKRQYNMDLIDVSVIFHGVGGLTLSGDAVLESQVAVDVDPSVIVVDLGANDLDSTTYIDPIQLAEDMLHFLIDLKNRSKVSSLVILQACHRTLPRRHDYNEVLPVYNGHLKQLCRDNAAQKIFFFPLKNMIEDWPKYLLSDGVHFNSNGMLRYFRNVRGAAIVALRNM